MALESNENKLGFIIEADLSEFKRQLADFDNRLIGMQANTQKTTDSMAGMFDKLGKLVGAYMSVGMLKNFAQQLINVRGQFQQLEIAFSTMLGSQEKANALMKELTETAAKTPFDMTSIAQGAKQLLAYGTASEEVNDTLVRLGNIASGLSIPLNDLVNLYGTTQVSGRVFAQDIRQFLGRGIPIVKELAKQFGVAESEVNELVSKGEVGFEHIRKALESMTNEGGLFFNLMEKQSASLTGQISNLEDAFTNMLNEIGKETQGALSGGISALSWAVENYKTLGKAVATITTTYGAYKSALIVSTAWERRAGIARLAHIKLIKMQTMAQSALNAVSKMNPYVALGAVIAGIVASVYMWSKNTNEQEKAQERLNKAMEQSNQRIKENADAQRESIAVIQDKTASIIKQVQAYNKLKQTEGSLKTYSIDELKAMSQEQIQGIIDQEQRSATKEEIDKLIADTNAKIDELKRRKESLEQGPQNQGTISAIITTESELNKLYEDRKVQKAQIVQFEKEEEEIRFNSLSDQEKLAELQGKIDALNEKREKAVKKLAELETDEAKSTTFAWETAHKSQTDALNAIDAQLSQYTKQVNAIKGVTIDEAKNYLYWEQKKKDATDAFHKSLPGTKEWNEAKANIETAEKEMEKWNIKAKQTRDNIKAIIDQWKELRKQTEQENELRGTAEFEKMRKSAEFDMTNKIEELTNNKNESLKQVGLTKEDKETINKSYDEAVAGIRKAFEVTTQNIDDEERDYLTRLNESITAYYKTNLENQIDDIKREAEAQIKDLEVKFGKDSAEYLENKDDIEKKRNAQIEDAEVQEKLKKEQEVLDIKVRQIELTKNVLGEERAELEIMDEKEASLERQLQLLLEQKHGWTEDEQAQIELIKLQLAEIRAQKDKVKKEIQDIRGTLADAFGNVGASLGQSDNGVMNGIGALFSQAGSSMNNYRGIQEKLNNGDKAGAYAQAVSGAVSGAMDMFNLLYGQAQKNKQALEAWDNAVRESAHKLTMLEIEEMGWRDTNIWGSANPMDKINKALEKQSKTSQATAESLEKLRTEGQVKTGTKKQIDVQTTLQATAIGAGIGASIGSMFGPIGLAIGTAAGALTGAIAGLIAGRKQVDVYDSLENQYGSIYDKDTLEINKRILADYDKMDEATKKLIDHTKELLEVQKENMEEFEGYIAEMTGDVSGALQSSLVDAFTDGNIYGAVDDFHDYVQKQMEDIISAKVFNSVFGDAIDQLSASLTDYGDDFAYNTQIEQRLASFQSQIGGLLGRYDMLMTAYQDAFEEGGYDLFRSQADVVQDALSGTIASMSEDTASKLNGNFMGLKLTAMEISANVGTLRSLASEAGEMMSRSLSHLNRIADNTAYCERLTRLDELADDIADIKRNGLAVR